MSTDDTNDTTGDRPAGETSGPFEAQVRAALVASAAQHTPDPDLEERIDALASRRSHRQPARWLFAAAVLVVVLVGAVIVRSETDRTVTMGPATEPATSAVPTTTPPSVGTDLPTEHGGAPTTGVPADVTPTTATPTTTAPPLARSAILRMDGIADLPFGGSTAAAEQAIAARIGPAVGRFTDPGCSARQIISWGSFALWDQSGTFVEWELIGDAVLGLEMERGGGIGTSASAFVAAYPEATVGLNQVEFPVRRNVSVVDEDAAVMWGAVLGDDDRTIAMGASGKSFWPDETCPGRGYTYLALQPHVDGLGMIAFGAPAPRVAAAMTAAHGDAVGGSATGTDGCSEVVTTRYGAAPFVSVLAYRGAFVGYRMPESSNGLPMGILDADGELLLTGTTLAEVRATFGDRVSVASTPGPDGSYAVVIRPVASDGGTALIAGATGAADTDIVTTVGAMRPPPC